MCDGATATPITPLYAVMGFFVIVDSFIVSACADPCGCFRGIVQSLCSWTTSLCRPPLHSNGLSRLLRQQELCALWCGRPRAMWSLPHREQVCLAACQDASSWRPFFTRRVWNEVCAGVRLSWRSSVAFADSEGAEGSAQLATHSSHSFWGRGPWVRRETRVSPCPRWLDAPSTLPLARAAPWPACTAVSFMVLFDPFLVCGLSGTPVSAVLQHRSDALRRGTGHSFLVTLWTPRVHDTTPHHTTPHQAHLLHHPLSLSHSSPLEKQTHTLGVVFPQAWPATPFDLRPIRSSSAVMVSGQASLLKGDRPPARSPRDIGGPSCLHWRIKVHPELNHQVHGKSLSPRAQHGHRGHSTKAGAVSEPAGSD